MSQDPAEFSTTQWSVVQVAGGEDSDASRRALEKLCQRYWPPLFAYACRQGSNRHDAMDLTQGFFERLLEKNYVAQADAERGRFRNFLLVAFKHYISKERTKAKRHKRGGTFTRIAMDNASMDAVVASGDLTADEVFDRQWTLTLLAHVMGRLESEFAESGKQAQFRVLEQHIIPSANNTRYAESAAKLGLTESATRMAASRLRQRYRELLKEEIARTVRSEEEVQDEVAQLFQSLG